MKRFYISKLLVLIALLSGWNWSATAQSVSTTFSTPGAYVFTVPSGCSTVNVSVSGAQGGNWGSPSIAGGLGGNVTAAIAVSSGQLLYVYVGAQAASANTSSAPGSASVGGGEEGGAGSPGNGGAGGGAASDIRTSITGGGTSNGSLLTRIVVGGGGGGAGYDCANHVGGIGGYPSGGTGVDACGYSGGVGGSQTAGGAAGAPNGGSAGTAGVFGNGGNAYCCYYGGGGGGGWYGGGGCYSGSAGGGSSSSQTVGINIPTGVAYANGVNTGGGTVTIVPVVPVIVATPTSLAFGPWQVGATAIPQYVSLSGTTTTAGTCTASLSGGAASVYQISSDGVTWGSSLPSPLTYGIPTFGGLTALQIYVRFKPTAVTAYSDVMVIVIDGTTINIPISGSGVNACSGTPAISVATATPSAANIYTPVTLSLSPAPTTGGFTYQWQSSTTGSAPWTNITGAVLSSYTLSGITATTYYRCIVTCSASGLSSTSSTTTVTSAGLATPGCTGNTQSNGSYCCNFTIGNSAPYNFDVTGALGDLIDNYPNTSAPSGRYSDYTSTLNVTEAAGTTVPFVIAGSQGGPISVQMWVDFNNNGTFEPSESVGGISNLATGVRSSGATFTIPASVVPGVYRFRVVEAIVTGGASYPAINPCPPTSYTNFDCRDYTMIIAPPPCSGAPIAGISATTAASACAPPFSFTPTLMNIGASNATGVTYNWQSSPDGITWSPIGGAVTPIYTPTVTTLGVTYFRDQVTCGGSSNFSSVVSVSLNPTPNPITPTPINLCTGLPTTLTSSPAGGTWTSSNPGVATTAGSTSGAVTGVTIGVTNITYTLGTTGCFVTAPATVNSSPAPIVGPSTMCVGSTATFSDATPGGTWGSSTPGVATVIPSTGVVTAVAAGTTTINYSSVFGCPGTPVSLTVNPLPTLFVVGPSAGSYCTGSPSAVSVTLTGSTVGIDYQLLLAGSGSGLPLLHGTGAALNFGIQSTPGVYTVQATNTVTGCTRLMVNSTTLVQNPIPGQYTVSGGGSYCFGVTASAPHIFLSGSQLGVNYRLQLGGTTLFALTGTGGPLDFGPQTLAGCYTVVAQNASTGCNNNMLGSACVTINTLPTSFNVTPPGGGGYCIGQPGIDIGLDFSNTGVTYTLFNGGAFVSNVAGTGGALNFGYQTAPGTYTVAATNVTTTCTAPMSGAATVTLNLPPTQHNVMTSTGGSTGSFCAGGAGIDIVLDGSDGGVNYQLYNGSVPMGGTVGGTGLPLDFGFQTVAGASYTIVATDATTLCTSNMLGSVSVVINPLPPIGIVNGGGNFCVGGPGRHIGLSPSSLGIIYQLYLGGSPVGSPVAGTGGSIDFGVFSALGIYTVIATDATTGCTATMGGVATISTNPLPFAFNVTGGGSYCSGSGGLSVGLDFSATGITYQLFRSVGGLTPVAVGTPVSGTGAGISFGVQTINGTYTVVGTNVSTGCSGNMAGSAIISTNVQPTAFLLTGGGNFCAGGAGADITLNGSETGVNYQLFVGLTPVGGAMPGTGLLIDFGLQAIGGTYTVQATNTLTGCSRYMTGGVPVNVYPLPDAFMVTGGGLYCAGTPGVHVGLSGSATGIKYQLYNGGATGIPATGTGGAIDFGIQIASGTYSVVAINNITGCTNNMTGGVAVATTPLPTVFNVTGGGNYCIGGAGSDVSLDGSEISVNYQLMRAGAPVGAAMAGTGSGLDLGMMTGAGSYTVMATNAITGCTKNMAGSAVVGISPLPTAYTVTGGGNFCAGGVGFHIILAGSNSGVSYQLYNDTAMVGTAMTGTGSGVDFGLQTIAGNYTVVATNPLTSCMKNMTGSANIGVYPVPAAHNVTGGGSYCAGGTGVSLGLDGSNFGTIYQLYNGSVGVGVPVPGTGSNINFGLHTAAGTYTVVAVTSATTCTGNMTGSATVTIAPLPTAYSVTGGGTYCATSLGVHVYLSGSDAGVNYQLWNGTLPVGIPVAGNGSALDFGYETLTGAYTVSAVNPATTCINNMTSSVSVSVLPVLLPHSVITSSVSGLACVGQTVNYTASPVNGGTAPTYQWLVNGIPTVTGNTFSYIPNNGDILSVQITSNYQCAIPPVGVDTMVVTVSPPEMPSATVAVSPGTQICTGGTATFTATTAYGGLAPNMLWIKNSVFAGTGSTFSYIPNNGDIVTFMLGSDFPCRLADTVFSGNITLDVQAPVLPVVTIAANPGSNITSGESVTFTATVVHGGISPMLQWVVNRVAIPGATNYTYTTSALANKDSVSCMVEGTCGLVGFNSVGITVHGTGVGFANVNGAGSDLILVPNPNKGDFTVKGSLATDMDQEVAMEVTDMVGQVVYTNKVMAHGGNINQHIQLSNLANGMYLMSVHSGDENVVFHFVIEQ